jgi:hypothetical protein
MGFLSHSEHFVNKKGRLKQIGRWYPILPLLQKPPGNRKALLAIFVLFILSTFRSLQQCLFSKKGVSSKFCNGRIGYHGIHATYSANKETKEEKALCNKNFLLT